MSNLEKSLDRHIGSRIRMRRTMLGLSQQKVAEPLGITWQQFQKIEKGVNRAGGGRLYQLAHILQTPVGFFFDGAPMPAAKRAADSDLANDPVLITAFFSTPHAADLAKAFCSIASEHRKVLVLVARAMAQS